MRISDFDNEKKKVSFEAADPETDETPEENYHYEDEKLEPYFEKAMLSNALTLDIVYEPSGATRIGKDKGKIIRACLKDWNGNEQKP